MEMSDLIIDDIKEKEPWDQGEGKLLEKLFGSHVSTK